MGIVLRLLWLNDFSYDKFIDRDVFRSLSPDPNFCLGGPELNGGGRTPGGLLHALLNVMYVLGGRDIQGIYIVYIVLNILGVSYFTFTVGRYINSTAAALTFFFLTTGFFYSEQFLILWNPTLPIFFQFLAVSFVFPLVIEKKQWLLIPIVVTVVISAQMHVSNFTLLAVIICTLISTKTKISLKVIASSLAIFIALYLPFFVQQYTSPTFPSSINTDTSLPLLDHFQRWFLVIANLSNLIYFEPLESLQWTDRPSTVFGLSGYTKYIVSLMTVFPMLSIAYLFRKNEKTISPETQNGLKIIRLLLLFSAIAFIPIIHTSYPQQYLALRRYIWAGPIFTLAIALGCFLFLNMNKRFTEKLRVLIMFGFTIFFLLQTYFFYSHQKNLETPENYSFKKELINIAKNEFQLTNLEIQNQIGLISKDNYLKNSSNWVVKNYTQDEGTGLVSLLGAEYSYSDKIIVPTQCYMAIRGAMPTAIKSTADLDSFLSSVHFFKKIDIDKWFVGKYGVYFSYRTQDRNCVSFFKSYYFMPEKNEIRKIVGEQTLDKEIPLNIQESNTWLFSQKLGTDAFLFFLKMAHKDKMITGKLFVSTYEISNYQGIGYFYEKALYLKKSKLKLTSTKTNAETVIDLFSLTEMDSNFIAPPLFFEFTQPKPDTYRLDLIIYTSETDYFEKRLSESLKIPPSESNP